MVEKTGRKLAQRKYEDTPKQVKRREKRNQARRTLERQGKVHKGDKKDVMHKDGNPNHNTSKNWKVGSQHANRSYARTAGGHKRNPRS